MVVAAYIGIVPSVPAVIRRELRDPQRVPARPVCASWGSTGCADRLPGAMFFPVQRHDDGAGAHADVLAPCPQDGVLPRRVTGSQVTALISPIRSWWGARGV